MFKDWEKNNPLSLCTTVIYTQRSKLLSTYWIENAGYSAEECLKIEKRIIPCDKVTCQNGGTLVIGINSIRCNCVDDFTGDRCELGNFYIISKACLVKIK